MPQVNVNPPSDISTAPKSRIAPSINVEGGFDRELQGEIHKLNNSATSESPRHAKSSLSEGLSRNKAGVPREGLPSSDAPTQVTQKESLQHASSPAVAHPINIEKESTTVAQDGQAAAHAPHLGDGTLANSAASGVLAALAVLLFSSVDSAGQNLPIKPGEAKQNGQVTGLPGSAGQAAATTDSMAVAPSIPSNAPTETGGHQSSALLSNQIAVSADQKTPQPQAEVSSSLPTVQRAQASPLMAKLILLPDDAGSAHEALAVSEQSIDRPLAYLIDLQEKSQGQEPTQTVERPKSVDFQNTLQFDRELLSTSDNNITTSRAADAGPVQETVEPSHAISAEIGKLLTALQSQNSAQDSLKGIPTIPRKSQEAIQTPSLSSTIRQTGGTRQNQISRGDNLLGRAASIAIEIDRIEANGQSKLEDGISLIGSFETKNPTEPSLENRTGTLRQGEPGNVAPQENLNQTGSLHQQLPDRQEPNTGQSASQSEKAFRTEVPSRLLTEVEGAATLKQEEAGTPMLATVHQILSNGDSLGSATGHSTSATIASNIWEQAEKANVISQLVEKFHLIGRNNESELVISLKPEFLGRINLRASMADKELIATLTAESAHVKTLLESQLPVLQHALHEQGLPFAKVVVLHGSEWNFSDTTKGSSHFQQDSGSRHAAPHLNSQVARVQHAEEPETSILSSIPSQPHYSRSINLIA